MSISAKRTLIPLLVALICTLTMGTTANVASGDATNVLPANTKWVQSVDQGWSYGPYAVTRNKTNGENFTYADISADTLPKNYSYKGNFTVKAIGDKGWMGPRFIFRMNDAEHFLLLMLAQNGDALVLERVPPGGWRELGRVSGAWTFALNRSYSFEIISTDTEMVAQIDGKTVVTASIPTYKPGIGVYAAECQIDVKELGIFPQNMDQSIDESPFHIPSNIRELGKGTYFGESESSILFGNEELEIGIRKSNLGIARIYDRGNQKTIVASGTLPTTVLSLYDQDFRGKRTFVSLTTKRIDDALEARIVWMMDRLQVTEVYRLLPSRTMNHWVEITNTGVERKELIGVRFQLDNILEGFDPSLWQSLASGMIADDKQGIGLLAFHLSNGDNYSLKVSRSAEGGKLVYDMDAHGYLNTGKTETVGNTALRIAAGTERERKGVFQEIYKDAGLEVPKLPDWAQRGTAMYSFYPLGHIDQNFQGGLTLSQWGQADNWSKLNKLGMDMTWLLPPYQRAMGDHVPYGVADYFKLDNTLGTEGDYIQFVDDAHSAGIHLIQDTVPHGGFPAVPNPEWMTYDKNGKRIRKFGQTYDYANPEWQQVQRSMAKDWTKKYGVDGWRVDVIHPGTPENWNSVNNRPSYSALGGSVNMLRALKEGYLEGIGKKGQQPLLLPETFTDEPAMFKESNMTYGGRMMRMIQSLQDAKATSSSWASDIKSFLADERIALPNDVMKLRALSNHDMVRDFGRNSNYYGEKLPALYSLMALIDGVPMYYQEEEVGYESLLAKLHKIKRAVPELGATANGIYDASSISATEGVFSALRIGKDGATIILVNLNGTTVDTQVITDTGLLNLKSEHGYQVEDVWTGKKLYTNKDSRQLSYMSVRLEPYAPAVLRIRTDGSKVVPQEDLNISDLRPITYH